MNKVYKGIFVKATTHKKVAIAAIKKGMTFDQLFLYYLKIDKK